ncbi:dehydrogenase [Chitinophaga sp. SYP-B3965]|uniref:PVC-type heme-binding CxxCH protein n=1 Tax=Chitinophaga sp. SYP-B3965 TaxID=2663120 RepID=UPI001299ACC9|nr:PVC-type heme-binding CxxCH protein [Chitinophaga sp. SYP-B3965]MRG44697.1 dehydrogenase [Chitinophaga sp. SYP-B3965]
MKKVIVLLITGLLCAFSQDSQDEGRRAEVLFFGKGDKTRHASWLATKLFKSGINLTYAENLDNLEQYDGVIINAALTPAQEQKVKTFVENGKGLVLLDVTGKSYKGRVFRTTKGTDESAWKTNAFLNNMRDSILWTLGDAVKQKILAANIPDVDIYQSDTIADYTKRYLVPKMQEALQPKQSNKLTQIPLGFEIQLFAQEPDITKPIAMAWDERGRLWIVETVDYPNAFTEVDSVANDRIKICEDTDGDGKADKFTVFADSLNIPTSITFANGGVILAMAPNFLFLKDTNGDDKADVRRVMFTGWAKQDTHSGPSNLQYGFDNKIWGVVGYSGFNGTIDGKPQRFGQGVYHFRSDGTDFEFLGRTSNNTWGLGISEDNNVFISTANNTHSAYYSLPLWHMTRSVPGQPTVDPVQKIDGHYDVHAMTPNLRQVDVVGGFTSATGHHLYTARNFPKEYWNRIAFVCEPTVRLVHQAIMEPDGAGFKEKDGWNLLASSDEWFAPVQAQVGPDGAVWIADWYNFIIQHNVFVKEQAPSEMVLPFTDQPHGKGNAFESKLRDSVHGRIYRIVHKDAKPYKPLQLSTLDVPGLVAALSNDNMFWRMHAQRLLVESQAKSAIPALYKIINDPKVDAVGLNSPAVHALWTLQGLGELNAASLLVVTKALKHPAAGVRKAALEVMPRNSKSIPAITQSGVLNDRNLQTRLAAFRALADYPASSQIGALLYKASQSTQNGKDPWLARALFAAVITHEKGFLAVADPASPYIKALQQATYQLDRGVSSLALDVTAKEITIKALLNKRENRELEGPLVVQGDKTNGYALFVSKDKLTMVVNQKGVAYQATTTEPLPDKMEITAQLLKTGQIRIFINDAVAATGKAPGLFTAPLTVALRTGEDMQEQQRVAVYASNRLRGDLRDVSLSLNGSGNDGAAAAVPSVVIDLKVVKDIMQYDKKRFSVKAGQNVTIRLENPDGMQHNLLIIKPGTLPVVGAAADAMVRDPKASQMQYVPKVPQVLHATRLLNPGETVSLKFIAPKTPGEYPFVCTFPGHWRGMNGIMVVTK